MREGGQMSRPFRKSYIATDVPIVPARKKFLLANYSLQDSLVRRRFFPRKIPHCLPRAMLAVVAQAIAFSACRFACALISSRIETNHSLIFAT